MDNNQPSPAFLKNEDLNKYVDGLIDDKGFTNLTPEVREQIKKDLMVRFDDFMVGRMIAALTDDGVSKFKAMLEEGKPEEDVQQFMEDNIPDFVNFLSAVLLEFRAVYLGIVNAPVSDSLEEQEETALKNTSVDDSFADTPPAAPVAPDSMLN